MDFYTHLTNSSSSQVVENDCSVVFLVFGMDSIVLPEE